MSNYPVPRPAKEEKKEFIKAYVLACKQGGGTALSGRDYAVGGNDAWNKIEELCK